jgi:hypothetical protein
MQELETRKRMATERYNRWQGLAITQLSVAVALITALSLSSLAVGFELLQNKDFDPSESFKAVFGFSFIFLLLTAFSAVATVISRTLDFQLTARTVRKRQNDSYAQPLTLFGLRPATYGRITWCLFGLSCVFFVVGFLCQSLVVWSVYAERLY